MHTRQAVEYHIVSLCRRLINNNYIPSFFHASLSFFANVKVWIKTRVLRNISLSPTSSSAAANFFISTSQARIAFLIEASPAMRPAWLISPRLSLIAGRCRKKAAMRTHRIFICDIRWGWGEMMRKIVDKQTLRGFNIEEMCTHSQQPMTWERRKAFFFRWENFRIN